MTVVADPADCAFQFDPVGKKTFASSCDLAKSALANAGVTYANQAAPAGHGGRGADRRGDASPASRARPCPPPS